MLPPNFLLLQYEVSHEHVIASLIPNHRLPTKYTIFTKRKKPKIQRNEKIFIIRDITEKN